MGISLNSPSSKKDKKKAKDQDKRLRTISSAGNRPDSDGNTLSQVPSLPDGAFLPLNLEPSRDETGSFQQPKENDYGYLSYERHVVLGLEQVARLVDVLSEELGSRGGITTPFIFSSLALDISSSAIKRLIRAFLNTCEINPGHAAGEAELRWREEARFAGPHELGMCLRWGLARVVRFVAGQEVRGLISWEHYNEFRDSEASEYSYLLHVLRLPVFVHLFPTPGEPRLAQIGFRMPLTEDLVPSSIVCQELEFGAG